MWNIWSELLANYKILNSNLSKIYILKMKKINDFNTFDVIVIGGGHAGIEAANIAAQLAEKVALISLSGVKIASAPCNPAIGGVAKGQVVKEIDALGGLMGKLADMTAIQYRTLNSSRGFAVQSTRVQIDKELYSKFAEKLLSDNSNLQIIKEEVVEVFKDFDNEEEISITAHPSNNHNSGNSYRFVVFTANRNVYYAKRLVVTVGTFLRGKLHFGPHKELGGRVGAPAAQGLSEIFSSFKLVESRFKTGTPARLCRDSVDFSLMEEQTSDPTTRNFSCLNPPYQRLLPQISCFITWTNSLTMEIIRKNKLKSPIFNGDITSIGPRYCPSIEDKANRYPDRDIHHVFIEPEGLELPTLYPNGLSTSLPVDIQEEFLRSIKGLEKVRVDTPGYAVEYDVFDSTRLSATLESLDIQGLYFAGQVNGTSGYEEAAGQGWCAGVNAALAVLDRDPLILNRYDSYIAVMIDDLITSKKDEPYRLFTARSENRLFLREDNVLLRMYPYRNKLRLNTELDRYMENFISEYSWLSKMCDRHSYSKKSSNEYFQKMNYGAIVREAISLTDLLKQSHLDPFETLLKECNNYQVEFLPDVVKAVAISKRYDGYIKMGDEQNQRMKNLDEQRINWEALANSTNISFECRQRIKAVRPQNFGQLRLIDGIRAATLAVAAGKLY